MFEGLRRRIRRRERLPEDDPAGLLSQGDRAPRGAPPPKAHKYVTREDDKDSDAEAADDGRGEGEELLDIDWDTQAVSSDFDLMSLKTGSGRAVAMPDEEKLQRARAVLNAADGEVLGAQSLPVGSEWPVVSLVTSDGPSKHIMQPCRLHDGDLDVQARDRSLHKRGRETEQ